MNHCDSIPPEHPNRVAPVFNRRMRIENPHHCKALLVLLSALLLEPSALVAFPPAPHHLFYGTVRNEQGNPIAGDNAVVLLETPVGAILSSPIISGIEPGANYKLKVPLDSGITADSYQPTALRPTVPFRIKVQIGSTIYLPIEMAGDFSKMGEPSGVTRLDLTLGVDSDGDGLPDAWELAMLQAAGKTNLSEINPDDDTDGDGLSNLQEYISGSYAYDSKSGFSLTVAGFKEGQPLLEFLAIRGRTYTVQGSANLNAWQNVRFRVPAEGDDAGVQGSYQAGDSRNLRIEVTPEDGQPQFKFFRLIVQ